MELKGLRLCCTTVFIIPVEQEILGKKLTFPVFDTLVHVATACNGASALSLDHLDSILRAASSSRGHWYRPFPPPALLEPSITLGSLGAEAAGREEAPSAFDSASSFCILFAY
ncbi:hypothetical protein E2C01_019748 [Portunus trituberculatus]|uniref:Uncharacterized protein n=1 Tax=Portunus trituberculatus TaxID=210409 RepID=A0A5B7E1A9_PORTR|nr:hypothetical protein [Portunus trituberculatus]